MTRRMNNTAAARQTDAIDTLLDALNGIEGIEFAEDAWKEKAPSSYGVLELTGEAVTDYAGGERIAQTYGATLTLYVSGGSHRWIDAVQEVLTAQKVRYSMPNREYLFDINKVRWVWQLRIRKKIIRPSQTQTAAESPEGTAAGNPEGSGADNG